MNIHLDFPEWKLDQRLCFLRKLNCTYQYDQLTSEVMFYGSFPKEVRHILNPLEPVDFNQIRSPELREIISRFQHQFWCWKDNLPCHDLEVIIADALRIYVDDLDCKDQDEWYFASAEQLAKKTPFVDFLSIEHVLSHNINWKRISALLFNSKEP